MSEQRREKMVAAAKPTAPTPDAPKERRTKTTLAELGPCLPIGIDTGGALVKDLAHRSWKTRDERELGKLKKPKMNMAQYVSTILAHLYTKVGSHDFTPEMDAMERRLKLGQMYMADIFYMYIWLRTQVISDKLKMNLTCPSPSCQFKFPFSGDLSTIDVYAVSRPEDLIWTYDLMDPLELRRKTVTKLRMSTARWASLESSVGDVNNDALGKIIGVRGSIVGLNEDPDLIQITDTEMDEMSKRDLETLVDRVNNEFIGPRMVVEGKCPTCENEFAAPIDWRYESFFSISSR